jgi:nitric oxide reductase activation protein
VSALFLLDMSASTDDVLPESVDPDQAKVGTVAADEEEVDDFPYLHYPRQDYVPPKKMRRIIDLEKESVVLMAEALEELGDNYSICGFSGYGRDQVDYYVCKSFNERYQAEVKGRLGAIKPCRSTRMGPAIRHATRELARTESRIKALIIISDGYPQDFDYGSDRNSREYGMQDTSKALNEARHKGVQTFCLTVDQSGHDYLRDMCPDQQYMVIRDLAQLPHELSKVYQGLTT